MPNSQSTSNFSGYLQSANTIIIVLNDNPSFDQQLAASSLYLALKQTKKVSLHGVSQVQNPTIAGLGQLKTELGHQNLRISFDYQETAVNNVSYHIDEESQKFFLTIRPKEGYEPLDQSTVNFDYVGAGADLIILFGVESLEDLKQLYAGYEDLYRNNSLITIGQFQPNFQSNHLDTSQTSSASEAVAHLLRNADLSLQSDGATNLLAGIQYQTNNFVNLNASADTFELVAWLLRLGANRKPGSLLEPNKQKSDISGEIAVKPEKNNQPRFLHESIPAGKPLSDKNTDSVIPQKRFEDKKNELMENKSENNSSNSDSINEKTLKQKNNFEKVANSNRPSGLKK